MNFYEKTLYHGTIIDNEPTIRQYGLVGGWHGPIGSFVDDAYSSDYDRIEPNEEDEIVFATDKNDLGKAITAMVHHISKKLNKDFHDVSDNDIRNHGLLIIIKNSELKPYDPDKYHDNQPRGVEPGDYYDDSMGADLFLRGSSLIRFLIKYNEWPRDWGKDSGDRKNLIMSKKQSDWIKNKTTGNQKILGFREWMNQNTLGTELVDSSQIERLYDKAKISVRLVQEFDKTLPKEDKLLNKINTILPLSSGVYGLYMSKENKKVIGKQVMDRLKLMFPKDMMLNQKINQIPLVVLRKYLPDVDEKLIQPSDTIHVNVQKILSDTKNDHKQAIIQIAATIVHEAKHNDEFHDTGKTNEIQPEKFESKFIDWANKNWEQLKNKIPDIKKLEITQPLKPQLGNFKV